MIISDRNRENNELLLNRWSDEYDMKIYTYRGGFYLPEGRKADVVTPVDICIILFIIRMPTNIPTL